MEDNTIIIKKSTISSAIPSSLNYGELAINCADGYIFFKKTDDNDGYIAKFVDLEGQPYVLNTSLSAINTQYGGNTVSEVYATILGGYHNNVSGAASTIINGENNDVDSDFSLIANGLGNKIVFGADFSLIGGGQYNLISHSNVFTFGSNLSSHADNFTYVNNISATGKLYGDGSELVGIPATQQFDYTVISTNNEILSTNQGFLFDTTLQALTAILPHSPKEGSYLNIIFDRYNNNNLTLLRNESKINNLDEDLLCDVSGNFSLVYINSSFGWKLVPYSGVADQTPKLFKASWIGPYEGPRDNLNSGSRIPYNNVVYNTDVATFGGIINPGDKSLTSIHIKKTGFYKIDSNIHLYDHLDGRNLYVQVWTYDAINGDQKIVAINDFNAGTGSTNDLIVTGTSTLHVTTADTYLNLRVVHDFPDNGPYPSTIDGTSFNDDKAPTEITITKL